MGLDEIKNLCLLHETEILERRIFSLFNVGINHFARFANQKTISHSPEPIAIYFGQQMMCHLFLKKNPLAVLDRLGEMCNDFSPIRLASCDYFFRIGMLDTGRVQIKSVKRLVNDNRIVPISPRPHHGRRDISRTRPHGDADGLSHPQRFSRYWRLDQRKWTPLVSGDRANSSGLTLRENANQRTARWRLRAKIANESSLGPDLHMTGRALGVVD